MKECHDSINKSIGQLSGLEFLDSMKSYEDIEPTTKSGRFQISIKNKCKICGDEYEFLVRQYYLDN